MNESLGPWCRLFQRPHNFSPGKRAVLWVRLAFLLLCSLPGRFSREGNYRNSSSINKANTRNTEKPGVLHGRIICLLGEYFTTHVDTTANGVIPHLLNQSPIYYSSLVLPTFLYVISFVLKCQLLSPAIVFSMGSYCCHNDKSLFLAIVGN